MRLYINYARSDAPICTKVAGLLGMHEVWYDQNIGDFGSLAERQQRLFWCDALIYILTLNSVNSVACHEALRNAQSMEKQIFLVLAQPQISIPAEWDGIDYIDFRPGFTTAAARRLLNVIFQAEQGVVMPVASETFMPVAVENILAPQGASHQVVEIMIDEAAESLDLGDYERAISLLKQVKMSHVDLHYVNIDALLSEAEFALAQETYQQQAAREYAPIVALMTRERTRDLGRKAFRQFRKYFPDYDPEDLAALCQIDGLFALEWCRVPHGEVYIERFEQYIAVDSFRIGKYPVTHAQYRQFAEAANGYAHSAWWNFSPEAAHWHATHPTPLFDPNHADDLPAVNVCWYEATAYCRWLSHETGMHITLPDEAEWRLAAQGNTDRRYPWGDEYNETYCNTKECGIRQITSVRRYVRGVSPYGVYDMAGNVWEWCINSENEVIAEQSEVLTKRVVKGGSFISSRKRAECNFYFSLNPECRYESIGFRVIIHD